MILFLLIRVGLQFFDMRGPDKNLQLKISQFDFSITPLQITFDKTEAQSYALQLCKGAQVYKKFGEVIWVHAEERSFKLVSSQSAELKINSENGLRGQWSIYKINDEELKDYFSSVPFDFTKEYRFAVEGLSKGNKIATLLQNALKNKPVEKVWNTLREKVPLKVNSQASNQQGITISYSIQIKHELDGLASEEQLNMSKKLSKSPSKMLGEGSKSYLEEESFIKPNGCQDFQTIYVPPVALVHAPSFKRDQNLSDIIQTSNEASSLYHEEKGHKVHPQIQQIPEEKEEQSPIPLPSAKTHNFDKFDLKFERIDKKRSNSLGQNRQYTSLQQRKGAKEDMPTAPQSSISEPSHMSSRNTKKSILTKVLAMLIVVAILGALYYFDFKGMKSQGIVSFLKNTSTNKRKSASLTNQKNKKIYSRSKKEVKKAKKTINTINKKVIPAKDEQEQQDYRPIVVPSKKGKPLDFNSNKKGSVTKRENQKNRNSIFNTISSWIFSQKNDKKRSKGPSWLESMSSWISKKKGGKDNKGKEAKKEQDEGPIMSGDGWNMSSSSSSGSGGQRSKARRVSRI